MSEQQSPRDIKFEQNSEYYIFHNLEFCSHKRELARWPLHITVVPPFRIPDENEGKLQDLVREIATDYMPFRVKPGENARFGPSDDVPVTKVINKGGELQRLHERFLWDLGSIGCHEIDATYAYERYSPHFTWKRGAFPPTESFLIDTLSIAKRADGIKRMLETTRLEY